jgi:Protein of unknown function (DUF3631)
MGRGLLNGKMLTARALADLLRPHGIRSRIDRFDEAARARGCWRRQFEDAWRRHLPAPEESVPSVTTVSGDADSSPDDTHGTDGTGHPGRQEPS